MLVHRNAQLPNGDDDGVWAAPLWTLHRGGHRIRCEILAFETWYELRFVHLENGRELRREVFNSHHDLLDASRRRRQRFVDHGWKPHTGVHAS